jgi:hypothetical protein
MLANSPAGRPIARTAPQLADLGRHRIETDVTRISLDQTQYRPALAGLVILRVVACSGDQRLRPGRHRRPQFC